MVRKQFKIMKSKVSWTLMTLYLIFMSFYIAGCGGSEESPILPDTPATESNKMTVSPETIYLKADGTEKGTFQVKLQKTASFFAKAEKDWCKLDNADGSGSSSYTVSVTPDPNTKTEERTSRISFYSGEHIEYAYVMQKAAEKTEEITITPDVHNVEASAGQIFSLVKVDNATAISITSDVDWCTPLNSNFEIPAVQFKLYMDVKENLTEQSRTAIITIKAGSSTKTCTVTQQGSQIDVSYIGGTVGSVIDLGLSVYWSSHNVGASTNTQSGVYFAWGEIKGKNDYGDDTYIYYDNDKAVYVDIGEGISGRPQYDAATAYWKEGWRIPTWAEFHELINECTWEWVQVDKVNGYKVTGPNKNSIFIPAMDLQTGNYDEVTEYTDVRLWSDCLSLTDKARSYGLNCTSTRIGRGNFNRYLGIPIRPVKYKKTGQAGGSIVSSQ